MNENIHQCYCVIFEQHSGVVCVCVKRDGEKRIEEEGAIRGRGGGLRTKETNLNEMTCFGGVKSKELGFSVPSPRRHIHLEGPDLCVCTPERTTRHKGSTARVKKIGGGKKERAGSSLIIHRQHAGLFFQRQEHILNSFRALKSRLPQGHFSEND